MIEIRRETTETMQRDGSHLFNQDWEETVMYSDAHKFSPMVEAYRQLEKSGRFYALSLRDDEKMFGYLAFIISKSVQTGKPVATCCGLYIDKAHRGGFLWKRLIEAAKADFARVGIDHIRISTSPKNDITKMLERIGFQKEETIFGMMIKGQDNA